MTAKSETVGVVAWMRRTITWKAIDEGTGQSTGHGNGERIITERKIYPDDVALIPLTDYERLISGLEALAGELELVPDDDIYGPAMVKVTYVLDRIRALIPAAANTESEETKS